MKHIVAAILLVAIATPATAQMMKGDMKSPSAKQCQMGYKSSYMKSMKWSKASFKKACSDKMGMMKDGKMKDGKMMTKQKAM